MQSVLSRIWTRVHFLRRQPLHHGYLLTNQPINQINSENRSHCHLSTLSFDTKPEISSPNGELIVLVVFFLHYFGTRSEVINTPWESISLSVFNWARLSLSQCQNKHPVIIKLVRSPAQSDRAVEHAKCISAKGYDPYPWTSVLDMALNSNWLQSWSIGECGVPLHCYNSQVHTDSVW